MDNLPHACTALNCQPGRWIIDTHHGQAAGRVPHAIEAQPLIEKLIAERARDYPVQFDRFRQELAARRTPAAISPAPSDIDEDTIPATMIDTLQVVGTSVIGVTVLGLVCRFAAHALGG